MESGLAVADIAEHEHSSAPRRDLEPAVEGQSLTAEDQLFVNIGVPRRDVGSFKLRGVWPRRRGARVCLILPYSLIKTQKDKSAKVLLEIPVDRDFIIYAATRTFFLPIALGDFIFRFPGETDGRGE